MNLGFKEKLIIVTGGAKGIGEAISLGLVEEGVFRSSLGKVKLKILKP